MSSSTSPPTPADEIVSSGVVTADPYLAPHAPVLAARHAAYAKTKAAIEATSGSLTDFALGFNTFGLRRTDDGGWRYTEWAPAAAGLALVGPFNSWDVDAHRAEVDEYGVWRVTIPPHTLAPGDVVKTAVQMGPTAVHGALGEWHHRIPAWIERVEQDPETGAFHGVAVDSASEDYQWQAPRPVAPPGPGATEEPLIIYEAHIGIASEELAVGSYAHFTANVLPRIAALGYNTVQLMAVMEHVYYGSFGYQVTSFFAASSRYGSRIELKSLIDTAHSLGLRVLLDVVHSHASKNVLDGLNGFDGSDAGYFHAPPRGDHPLWDSRVFDYSQLEVLRFLLSNLRYWIDEFHFDGMRFDGVTSMLYTHHGVGMGFSGSYDEYFGADACVDTDAVVYLKLANELVHSLAAASGGSLVTIAEDVSGMPTLCRPVDEGGVGFDARLAMALPDMWIKLLKEVPDEEWNMGHLVHTLTNRRFNEATIAYAESHDQALVGDKTIAFWLMDADMYTHMSVLTSPTPRIDRGIALHKLIRALTYMLGGDGWLAFCGAEFGHPEWLDFPREGNSYSHKHAPALARPSRPAYVSAKHEADKIIAFDVSHAVVVFNFHPSSSFESYRYGGHARNALDTVFFSEPVPCGGRDHSILVYSPSRTVVVYKLRTVVVRAAKRPKVTLESLDLPGVRDEVAEMEDNEVVSAIEAMVLRMAHEILAEKGLTYEVPSRSSSNQQFVPELNRMVLKSKTTIRDFTGINSVRKTAITTRVLQLIHELCSKGIHVTKRDLFYTDVKLFEKQTDTDDILDDVATMIGCTRTSLNVVASEKGVVVGRVSFRDAGDLIDCTRMGVGGKAIPPFTDRITDIESDAEFILVVEKDAAFMRLAEDRFYNTYPCIIITAKGQPDVSTRRFLKRLKEELNLPVLGLFDSDPYGCRIFSVYTTGSKNLSYDSASLATPDIKWLGVRPSDLDRYNIPEQCRLPLSDRDITACHQLLKEEFIKCNPEWVKELKLMLKTKVKAEIQALATFGFTYLSETYLPQKLAAGDWI
ncbi:uncharacterized protein AMSG_12234 [Thecamonas trahens ATCC 50062]|uniref:Meiotic recombination protein SPO11-3 n=1 Tax=Thecamonas trahens ATCC 50062 TaxID=461836 RepID=A0A0L0DLK3_THETB|nr:hypothetical protein AMSG_12234 [Thecamonas trahens ATCC 50062]KNC52926.1 hypothetical protein AMSG_12234 [Thecamonas trahens ATCC 50062]|eukprot:XP_013754912.1 hypothetical protein AMSG_12234 [Thecamonas trahens ATCC 50062]